MLTGSGCELRRGWCGRGPGDEVRQVRGRVALGVVFLADGVVACRPKAGSRQGSSPEGPRRLCGSVSAANRARPREAADGKAGKRLRVALNLVGSACLRRVDDFCSAGEINGLSNELTGEEV